MRRVREALFAIPAEMFARDPDSSLFAVKDVQGVKMLDDDITRLRARECSVSNSLIQMCVDSAEDPRRAMARAPDHHSVGAGEIKYLARVVRRADISVRENWNSDRRFDIANGLVLGGALIEIRARSAVNGEGLNAATLRNLRDDHAVAMLTVPSRADLERYGHTHCAHDGIEDARHEPLILQQRGAAQLPADLLRSEEHTSELQSRSDLVCRLLLEKKKKND